MNKQIEIDCPRCGGYWYEDLDETGRPYTCFYCCNGTVKIYQDEYVNGLLDEIAADDIFAETEQQYEEMMNAIFAEYNNQMYAANSYDLDAQFYGEQ